jgi:histidine triad (HIT) family protein
MTTCPFCARVQAGDYEPTDNADIVTFEPLNPVTAGHRLFLPRVHVPDYRARPKLLGRTMTEAARWALTADENLIISSGGYATQTVMHFHVHLVPRRPNDGLQLPWSGQQKAEHRA